MTQPAFARRRIDVSRHASAAGSWELARARPAASLRPHVVGYCGWLESTREPICRIETPTSVVPLIILFESPVIEVDRHDPSKRTSYRSFVAGLSDAYTLVGSGGPMAGIQVDLTPIGARCLLGFPLEAIGGRMVEIEDIWGAETGRLIGALAEERDWEARFSLLDREIAARIARHPVPDSAAAHALTRLVQTGGAMPVRELVEASGWSSRHFIARFRREFGLAPKTFARVLRFQRALDALKRPHPPPLADLAAACGYADQSHFTRDFRAFAGRTPTGLLAARLPDAGGFVASR